MNKLTNSEYLTTNADDYFQRLIDDIDQAQKTIELETYIFEADKIGNLVLNALCKASDRGLQVRLIIDGFGSSVWLTSAINKLMQHQVQVKIYHPLPWRFWQWGLATNQENFFNKLIFLISRINRRNHRKFCIIDENIHWIGSFNLSAVHLIDSQGGDNWRDSAVRLTTNHKDALNAFNKTWLNKRFVRKESSDNFPYFFRLNNSLLKRRHLYKDLLHKIINSDCEILITTPYFIPEAKLLHKLKQASQKGVDIKILLPAVSDVFFMPWASSLFYSELIQAGVKIYEYNAGVLHAKTLVIDNWATIGSSNMNSRSIIHDLEIDYELQNKESIDLLKHQFLNDLKQSNLINANDIKKRSPIIKLLGHLILYLRYWL